MRTLITRTAAALLLCAGLLTAAATSAAEAAAEGPEGHGAAGVDWQSWKADNEVGNTASLQRGARNFVNYCLGCHSLKYMRYQRMATDLQIPADQLRDSLIPTGAKPADYMLSTFPAADGEAWFGKAPPDLSLIARAKGTDYVYRFLKGFYVDETRPIGTNNLALPGAAMPAVLSDLEGVKRAVFHTGPAGDHGGLSVERFDQVSPGVLKPADFDAFVRDTANFLDYVGEPAQVDRVHIGIWVVLFLLVFTWFAWLLKQEYWKDIH
jgi:ubiquinol-cytochrome c reductase cytochrome c1 subunit